MQIEYFKTSKKHTRSMKKKAEKNDASHFVILLFTIFVSINFFFPFFHKFFFLYILHFFFLVYIKKCIRKLREKPEKKKEEWKKKHSNSAWYIFSARCRKLGRTKDPHWMWPLLTHLSHKIMKLFVSRKHRTSETPFFRSQNYSK